MNVRESEGVNSPVFDPDIVMDMQVPPEQGLSLQQQDKEERELFGSVSDDDGESSSSDSSGEDEYDDDSSTLRNINCPLHNENALTFFVNVEVSTSKNIVDYYSLANLCDSELSNLIKLI